MKEKSTKASQEAIKNTSIDQSAAPEAPAPKRKRAKPKTLQEARADEGMKAEAAEEIEARNRKRAHRSRTEFDPEKTSLEYLHDISRSLERIAKKLETLERIERSREKRVLYGLVDDGFF